MSSALAKICLCLALGVGALTLTRPAGASVCVIDSGGSLIIASTETAPACSQFVLQETGEPTANDIFTMPLAEDLAQVWMVSFSLVMIIYLSAWALGRVIKFASH